MPDYDWWNQEIFEWCIWDYEKSAYDLAVLLHNGILRKNWLPYLTHINGSIQKYEKYQHLFGVTDPAQMKMYICLHDIAEDDDDGVELIEKEFGIEILTDVLWMSIPKKRVRDGVVTLIWTKPEYRSALEKFTSIYLSAQNGKPTDEWFSESLTFLLPWKWHNQWESQYSKWYTSQGENPDEQKNIFAKYIFQWMIENMPDHLFLVKCIERLDNLSDRKWLKNAKDATSYIRTAQLTEDIYCSRLDKLGYSEFADILRLELVTWVDELQEYVRSQVEKTIST